MLVRILNTLRSRIWDMVFVLFSDYLNLQSVRMGILQKSITFQELKFQETDIYRRSSISSVSLLCYFLLRKNEAFSAKSQNTILMVCIPSSRQLKKYKIFVLPGWISGNIFMPPIVAFHEIPLVLRLQVLSVVGRLYSNLYIL